MLAKESAAILSFLHFVYIKSVNNIAKKKRDREVYLENERTAVKYMKQALEEMKQQTNYWMN